MPTNKHIALDRKETILRQIFAIGTMAIAALIVMRVLNRTGLQDFWGAFAHFGPREIAIVMLYGIFTLWCSAHLDVFSEKLLGGKSGRIASLELGLVGRAFTQCGAWTRSLRWRVWSNLRPRRKPSEMLAIAKTSRAIYVFGLIASFLILNFTFPKFFAYHTGFEEGFVRLIFFVLMGGTIMLASQKPIAALRAQCFGLAIVLTGQLIAAFAFFVLIHPFSELSYGMVVACFMMASGMAWALRVPFLMGVLEVALISVCATSEIGAVLAACAVFHVFFQGPALFISLWISFAPGLALPVLIGSSAADA